MKNREFHVRTPSSGEVEDVIRKLDTFGLKRHGFNLPECTSFINVYSNGEYQLCTYDGISIGEVMSFEEFSRLRKDDVVADYNADRFKFTFECDELDLSLSYKLPKDKIERIAATINKIAWDGL